jgi:capsular exopolysaccharide synthesis family protein
VRAALTSILMSGQHGQSRQVILVTSPSPREGKSTVASNLAIALAEIHRRVLLVDADLRRPRLHAIFGQANTWGLTDLLQDETPCEEYGVEALARETQVPGLFLLPSGAGFTGSSRLLYLHRMAELLARLRGEFDAIVIDTPPVLSLADARMISRFVDGVVLVFRAGQTQREAAAAAANLFEADGTPVFGTVLNDWNPRTMGTGGYPSDEYLQYYYPDAANG